MLPSYHFAAQVLARSQGRSAIKAAAYRAGERLRDRSNGEVHDFSRRRGVAHSEILLPQGAPAWMKDRERLWNHAEQLEKRRDAQLAREINIALPHDIDGEARRKLLLDFVREAFVSRGMVADVAFHDPVLEKGDDPRNYHAHVMLTLRQATPSGLRAVKTREWNSDKLLTEWREKWAQHQNRALARGGARERVDHRTLKAQREEGQRRDDIVRAIALDRDPEIHVGPRFNKAEQSERPPHSRDREVGPCRRRGDDGRVSRRVVRYTDIDRGSRRQRNAAIIRANLARLEREVARWQARSARLGLRRQWLSRAELEARWALEQLSRQQERKKQSARTREQRALARAMAAVMHRRKRLGSLERVMAEVERTLAGLLEVQERQLRRHKGLSRGPTVLLLLPRAVRTAQRGRSRARRPNGPSSWPPGNA